MKKFFLMLAAGLIATGASAQKLVWEKDYATGWNYYVMGYTPEVIDGVLTSNNPMEGENGGPSWYQYFIADGVPTKIGESYTVVVNCKASEECTLGMNMGWGWGDGEVNGGSIKMGTEWADVEVSYKPVGGTSCNVVLQPGTSTATVEIKTVKVYQNPPAAQYETTDVMTVNYADGYPYEAFDAEPTVENGILYFPEEGEMFSAMEGVPFEPENLYGIKTKIRGSKAGNIQISMGDWGAVAVATLEVDENWNEVSLPIGLIPNDEDGNPVTEGFVIITTKDEESGIYYDGVLEMEYCTAAVFVEIPPVVIPTEWVSIIQNGDANNGTSPNLVDRDATIEGDGNNMENDCDALICDNPDGSGKVFYCPISADPAEAWSSQFFILFDEGLEEGANLRVSFDFFCTDERNIETQAHGKPGNYHHWAFIGTLAAKPEWQHKEWEGEIAANQAGDGGCWSIAFNLSSTPDAATFYINNVVVEVEKEVGDSGVKNVNAIIVPAQGVYNFQGIKVANSIEEVVAPGMYIANGKKVVVK